MYVETPQQVKDEWVKQEPVAKALNALRKLRRKDPELADVLDKCITTLEQALDAAKVDSE